MSIEIKNIMHKPPIFISETSTIYEGAKKMSDENKGSLLIGNYNEQIGNFNELKGILTERDIIRAIAAKKDLNANILEIATKENLITIDEDENITKAAVLMSKHNIRHLIVKSGDKVSGILSTRDLMRESNSLKELSKVKSSDWYGSD